MLRENGKKQENQKALVVIMIYEDNTGRLKITRIAQNHQGTGRKQETTRMTSSHLQGTGLYLKNSICEQQILFKDNKSSWWTNKRFPGRTRFSQEYEGVICSTRRHSEKS